MNSNRQSLFAQFFGSFLVLIRLPSLLQL